eukprot:CAMPEP_0114305124 /NCGR_PEP_ID=MMETSP0059-20121206/16166_1 /TAXON_ID=36894 /ORGANISM="Pyramimonas parkeae, Strain CCMP726" /LENGTH=118 /DNA_ID=CAMNT_0001428295 /DNA_START=98 /DNA_END=454 /DNA_ORIENTATION=-
MQLGIPARLLRRVASFDVARSSVCAKRGFSGSVGEGEEESPSSPYTKYPHITVDHFLGAIGGNAMVKHASHFKTVDEILVTKTGDLKRKGLGVKERKQLLKMVEHFKQNAWSPSATSQ